MSYISARSLSRLSMSIAANQLVMSVKAPFRQWFPDPSTAGSNVEKLVSATSWTINGDGHASENFKMGLWGVTHAAAADNWDSDTLACVHLGVSTAGVVFPCIGRKWLDITPAATAIGSLTAAPSGASSQGNAFIPLDLANDGAKGPYASCPLIPYGSFRMQKNQADATHWALPTAVTLGHDGWGLFNEKTQWTFPDGLNGAGTGSFLSEAGAATSLVFTGSGLLYWLNRDNECTVSFASTARAAGDASATNMWMHMPYSARTTAENFYGGLVRYGATYVVPFWNFGFDVRALVCANYNNAVCTVAGFSDAGDAIFRMRGTYKIL